MFVGVNAWYLEHLIFNVIILNQTEHSKKLNDSRYPAMLFTLVFTRSRDYVNIFYVI